jgi:hypothetical protein
MKRLILIALIVLVTAGIVFAQVDVPGNALTSPQSAATSGRIRSTADNFIRADAYTDVKFDKFYTMMGYQNAPSQANLGFATKAGNMYIGTYYGGTFWANTPNINYKESNGAWLNETNKSGVKTYTDNNLSSFIDTTSGDDFGKAKGTAPSNNLSLLIGIADMGFRLSLYTNKRTFSDSDFVHYHSEIPAIPGNPSATPPVPDIPAVPARNEYYKSYETESGVIIPQLLWSMTKNLTSNGIKPYAAVNLAFTKNYIKQSLYDNTSGSWVANEEIKYSDINTVATIYAGLGGYTLLNKDGFRFSADIDYILGLTSYDNEYNYKDSSNNNKTKTGFKGTYNADTEKLAERSVTSHTITPSLIGQWSGGPLAFRFKFNLGVPITETLNTSVAFKTGATDGSLVKNGVDSKATSVGFNPDLRLAAQWKIVPNLALNLGGRINFNTISTTTTEGKSYANDKEVDNSSFKTVTTSNPTSISNTLAMGVTFNATDNLTFEVASGASNGNINVFGNTAGVGGLFYFTNLLVSLKY